MQNGTEIRKNEGGKTKRKMKKHLLPPEVHEIDFDAIIKKRIANGRKTGVFKGSVRRHLEKNSSAFLCK